MFNPIFFNNANSLDPDARAFIVASGITDATQKTAINKLVKDLKNYSIWIKMKAIYPMIGGTATTHKYNLKNPVDSDAAFRLVFTGGWTHSATGALPNGSTGYADTKFNALGNLSLYDASLGYYSRTQSLQTNNIEMGSWNSNATSNTSILSMSLPRNTGNGAASHTGQTNTTDLAIATGQTSTQGLYINSRISSTASDLRYIKNGSVLASATTNTGVYSIPSASIFIGAFNAFNAGNIPMFFSNKECAFSFISTGLTNTESLNLYNIVQAYQTTLGRQV